MAFLAPFIRGIWAQAEVLGKFPPDAPNRNCRRDTASKKLSECCLQLPDGYHRWCRHTLGLHCHGWFFAGLTKEEGQVLRAEMTTTM